MLIYKSSTKGVRSAILSVFGLSMKFAKKIKSFPFLQIKYNLEQLIGVIVSAENATKSIKYLFFML